MTWESFEKLPNGDGLHRELIEGELQLLPPPKSGHSNIASRIFASLLQAGGTGEVYAEAGYQLTPDRRNWIQPDVSFLRTDRVRATPAADYFIGAPDLAVEVVSPSESAADLNRKVALLLENGSLAVWVVYPEQREVHEFRPGGCSRKSETDSLTLPELFPGWEFPVARLFQD